MSSSSFASSLALEKGEKLYQEHCFGCHGSLDTSTKLNKSPQQIADAMKLIPQMKTLKITTEDIQLISAALKPGSCTDVPVGATALQRLNKVNYTNAVRSIFGISSSPGESLPSEPLYNEFSNLGDKQSINEELANAYLTVSKSIVDEAVTANRAGIFVCAQQTDACARQIVATIAEKAYNRPLKTEEITTLLNLRSVATAQGEGFEAGVKLSLQGILMAPQFLFRFIEKFELSPNELATRLAYFIWSGPPDQTLLNLAKSGELRNQTVLQAQVVRMLKDAKAQALVDQFAMQWLRLHQLKATDVARPAFPAYDNALKDDMIEETKQLFTHIMKNDLSPLELFEAEYSFLNEKLAGFYGVTGVTGTQFRRVDMPGNLNRRGILTHASILSMTSKPAETSIIHRGVWVLSNILCDQPEPPPPNITQDGMLSEAQRSRDRLANPDCAKCHAAIDNIGAGFENYNPIGQWRTQDSHGNPVSAKGTLIGSGSYTTSSQLLDFIAADRRIPYCFARKMVTFATGREITAKQRCAVREIGEKNVTKSSKFSDLVIAVVQSEFFRYQDGRAQ